MDSSWEDGEPVRVFLFSAERSANSKKYAVRITKTSRMYQVFANQENKANSETRNMHLYVPTNYQDGPCNFESK